VPEIEILVFPPEIFHSQPSLVEDSSAGQTVFQLCKLLTRATASSVEHLKNPRIGNHPPPPAPLPRNSPLRLANRNKNQSDVKYIQTLWTGILLVPEYF